MPPATKATPIFHITDVTNLPGILARGLLADAIVAQNKPTVIGYDRIKQRRLTEIVVPCCGNRFVGEFVPFYYCPRSPMLFTVNLGRTGRPAGCQKNIIHLVSTYEFGVGLGNAWAVSDGNAGAYYTGFYTGSGALNVLNWAAINAKYWNDVSHQKQAEFLVADTFPWNGISGVGCYNDETALLVKQMINAQAHKPQVRALPSWYY